jgi:putative ABC transport system substrate-binding protein
MQFDDLRRRKFITLLGGAAAAWPFAARAQPSGHMRRIGVLIGSAEGDPETKARLAAFRAGLARRGWTEGHNVIIEYRFAAASGRHQVLAGELVALKPDVILGHSTAVVGALQRETRTIPIVFINVSDPIGAGFIVSLARPGGNLTGVMQYEASIVGKWLAMLKEIAPRLARAVLLANPKTSPFDYFVRSATAAAPTLAIDTMSSPVETTADIERAIAQHSGAGDSGLVVLPDSTMVVHRDLVIRLAARHRVPAIYPYDFFVAAGGLMSYGTDPVEVFRQAASYVDRILRGDKPADLPVQAPTKYETVINLKTAKALGLTVPPALLVAADEVIE